MSRRRRAPSGLPEPRHVKTALTELRRAVREALGRFEFAQADAASALAYLGTSCVFCDAPAVEWDLLVPLRSGGETVLGNVVPVCAICHGSKREQMYDAWLLEGFSSPKLRGVGSIRGRIQRLRAYMRRFGCVPTRLEDRLGPEGMKALAEVQRRQRALQLAFNRLLEVVRGVQVPPNHEMQRTKPAQAMELRR